jgi:two-component system cell cycle response regulator
MVHHILVVDDNDLNLVLLAKILELEGYQVTMAHSGAEAIKIAAEKMPDLALLDVMMPEMNGYELCRKMRQPPLSSNIPIVMLTAMSSEGERVQSLEAGANEIWSKPFDMDVFRRRIGELLKIDNTKKGSA